MPQNGDGEILLPRRLGKVQRAVLDDLVSVVNDRLARGETRAVPYSSYKVAERLDLDDSRVREALRRLRDRNVVKKVGELPNAGSHDDGTPLYALAVRGPCPGCSSDIEARASVADLDAHDAAATGDRKRAVEPGVEEPDFSRVAVAEVEDLVHPRLAASERSTSPIGCSHGETVDQADDRHLAFMSDEPRAGPPRESRRVQKRREFDARRAVEPSLAVAR